MRKNKKNLSVNELKVGMIVAKEIECDGKVLIGEGIPINELIIDKLKEKYFFNKVEVYYEENMYNSKIEKLKTVEEIDENFNELSFDAEYIFNNMKNLQVSGIDEVRKFAIKIQDELRSTRAVIKNIVLYGSGTDIIYRHSVNVAALSAILGRWIGLNNDQINLLTYSAILHDFGKTKIDKNILDKVQYLNEKELNILKSHPVIGYNSIKQIPFLDKSVSYGVLMHHESLDGLGYPLGLKEKDIHMFAKIIAIADLFDEINSDRANSKSKRPFEALEIVREHSLGKLDYRYCKVFLDHVVNYYMGENVLLNNNKTCKIIQIDVNDLKRPLLLHESDFINLKHHRDLYIEKLIL